MVNCDIYVLNTVKNCFPMSSTITVLDSDEEVIDLESSQNAITESTASNDNETIITVNLEDSVEAVEYGDDSLVAEEKVEVEKERANSEPLQDQHEEDPKPLFKVMFRDESISRKYGVAVKEFFQKLVLVKPQQGCENVCSELLLEIWGEEICKEDNINSTTESEDGSDFMCENTFFTMSKEPMLIDARDMSKSDIPTYEKKYHTTVNETGVIEEDKSSKDNCMPKRTCFNCCGYHNLKDCTEPRNQANINKNRKEFNLKSSGKAVRYHLDEVQKFGHMIPGQLSKNLRKALGIKENELPRHIYRMRTLGYPPGWLEEARLQHSGLSLFNSEGRREIDPTEEPGEIIVESDRDRYDIKKIYEFPGYNVPAPPGTYDDYKHSWNPYVEAAHSKRAMLLRLNDKKADDGYKRKKLKLSGPVASNDSNCELSEMDAVEVDESVVEIVPVTGHFLPPLPKSSPFKPPPPQSPHASTHSPAQSPTRSCAEPSVAPSESPATPFTESPPTPLTESSTTLPTESPATPFAESPTPSSTQSSMPPQPSLPPQPSSTVQGPSEDSDCQSQELQSPDSADGSTTPSSRTNSPSLFDLETMKKQILVELEDSSSLSNSDSASKVAPSATSSKPDMPPPTVTSTTELNVSVNNSVNNSVNESLNNSLNNSLNTSDAESSGLGTTKSVDFGTPILQSTSPYNKLPSSEKFSKNICDVINFENLPDSTGKYEQMTGVIQKVRSVLARIHKE